MVRNVTLTACLLAGCVWCFSLVSRADSAEPGGSAAFKPVASVEALMIGQGLVFKEIGAMVANKQAQHRAEALEAYGELLAELANLNTLKSDKQDYVGWAGELRDTALGLSAEGKKGQDADESRIGALFQQMRGTCKACHDAYQ